jgi:hypothetical protein
MTIDYTFRADQVLSWLEEDLYTDTEDETPPQDARGMAIIFLCHFTSTPGYVHCVHWKM